MFSIIIKMLYCIKGNVSMLKSMTAFGRASADTGTRTVTVEIRSVNSRYLDCAAHFPRSAGFTDDRVRQYLIFGGVSRGKVDVSVNIENTAEPEVTLSVDREYLKSYLAVLHELRDVYGLADDISVMKVAADKNVITAEKAEADAERDWAEIRPVLDSALAAFLEARSAEGERIETDLRQKLSGAAQMVDRIESLSLSDVSGSRNKIEERLRKVLDDLGIRADENRILTECAIYADKIAIDEELVRLRSHFGAFETIMSSGEPAGRKLDFLMQEMNREVNTIGSKCQNAEIAQTVVDVKCELEKIREQIQNIE